MDLNIHAGTQTWKTADSYLRSLVAQVEVAFCFFLSFFDFFSSLFSFEHLCAILRKRRVYSMFGFFLVIIKVQKVFFLQMLKRSIGYFIERKWENSRKGYFKTKNTCNSV